MSQAVATTVVDSVASYELRSSYRYVVVELLQVVLSLSAAVDNKITVQVRERTQYMFFVGKVSLRRTSEFALKELVGVAVCAVSVASTGSLAQKSP